VIASIVGILFLLTVYIVKTSFALVRDVLSSSYEKDEGVLNRTKTCFFGVAVLFTGILALSPQAARAAEHCPVKVESIEEDRAMAESRPIWTARRFSVTMLSNTIVPGAVRIRAYTLGHVFHGQIQTLRWFPTEAASIFRSAPVVLAFPDDELLLYVGVICRGPLRLRSAYSTRPNLSLAPLDVRDAVAMRPAQPLTPRGTGSSRHAGCPERPVRIIGHVNPAIHPVSGAPRSGGPYVGLVGVRVSPEGRAGETYVEVSSGLPWFDAQVRESARRQIYAPAYRDCRPVAGTYYFSGQFGAENEGDGRHVF
jgi:hypothetical protein